MTIKPFPIKKWIFPKKFKEIGEQSERGTCHLDWRGVPPCPPSTWTKEITKMQDRSENKNRQQSEESE